ncbi:hypothetical protein [Helicobacter rappini]|nr:hypothetical protein [Helicobacter rappini]
MQGIKPCKKETSFLRLHYGLIVLRLFYSRSYLSGNDYYKKALIS